MHRAVIDHRSQEFARLGSEVLENLRPIFQTTGPVVIYPASGTGAWEAAIVNTLSPGDRVLMFETGHFSQLWRQLAERFGIVVDYVPGNWRRGAAAAERSFPAGRRRSPYLQSSDGGSQRDLHRSHQRHRRHSAGDESVQPSGVADGGYDLFPGLHRLSPRRMGSGCDRCRFAEGPDAAARPEFQRHL